MNKNLKGALIVINCIMLFLAIYWYNEEGATEPIIVFLGQATILLGLLFEKQISNIRIKKIRDNSDVDFDLQSGDNASASDIMSSKVKIKTRK